MLLNELFSMLPEDYGHLNDPPSNLPSFDPKFSKIVGTFDGHDIWGSRELGAAYNIFGIRDGGGVVLAYAIVETQENNGAHKLREIWANQQARGQGYATAVLMFVLRKLNVKLLISHDEPVSDDGRSFIVKGLKAKKFTASKPDKTPVDYQAAQTMFNTIGKTADEIIIEGSQIKGPIMNINKDITGNRLFQSPNYVIGSHEQLD